MSPCNARFWIWHNDGWVKITLRPDHEVSLCSGGSTDEGYSSTVETYRHGGDRVFSSVTTDSSDCDGRHGYQWDGYCPLGNLADKPMWEIDTIPENRGIRAPEWQKIEAWQRDAYAEAMGY